MEKYIMALDQGTTSSRCILFDKGGKHLQHGAEGVYPDLSKARLGRA